MLVKAENDVAGLVTTFGGRTNSTPAEHDSEVVRRLRAAGAVIVGTTHMPEFGIYPFTEGTAWGTTRNPHDPTRTPGGSSGGSAAAVAARLVPVAIGGDGGGSIRVPASSCGVVGLKPVRGRVSTAPHPDLWGMLGTLGPLTRSVADTALVYDVIAGTTPVDRFHAENAGFVAAAASEPGRLRVGWTTRAPWLGIRTSPEIRRTVIDTAAALMRMGHEVEPIHGRWPDGQRSFIPLFYAAVRDELARVEHPERAETRSRTLARVGRLLPSWEQERTEARAPRLARAVSDRFADYDVLLTPTMACLPPPIGQLDGIGAYQALQRSMPMVAFSTLATVTGHAAMSFPVGTSRGGLPIGLQLYAPRGDETTLLALAAQLEGVVGPGPRPRH